MHAVSQWPLICRIVQRTILCDGFAKVKVSACVCAIGWNDNCRSTAIADGRHKVLLFRFGSKITTAAAVYITRLSPIYLSANGGIWFSWKWRKRCRNNRNPFEISHFAQQHQAQTAVGFQIFRWDSYKLRKYIHSTLSVNGRCFHVVHTCARWKFINCACGLAIILLSHTTAPRAATPTTHCYDFHSMNLFSNETPSDAKKMNRGSEGADVCEWNLAANDLKYL